MYPSRFRYEAPRSLDEAIGLLHNGGDYAKVLAGGQSLVPLMKLRFASPELVVDINNVPGLDYHRADPDGTLHVGALCRHADLERSDLLKSSQPTMAAAAPLIADPIVRNRGTLVGSLCHADPQGDWASVVMALGGSVVASGPGGRRAIPIADFVTGPFQNVLEPDEIAVEAVIPAAKGARAGGYLKLERRVGDFATVGVAVAVETSGVTRDPGRDRADRGRRIHDRRQGGRRRAGRRAADRREHRPGRRPRGRGGTAQDRSSRQRRVQAAHGAHVRHAHPGPRRAGGEKGGLTMTVVYEDLGDEAEGACGTGPPDPVQHQRQEDDRRGGAAAAASHLIRRGYRADRHAHGLRHHQLRRVHGAGGRQAGEVLHDAGRSGRRARDHDGRGPGEGGRVRGCTRCRRASRRSTGCSAGSARRA